MKRKYGDRANWKRVTERRYAQTYLETVSFRGYVSLLQIIKVQEPLYVTYANQSICLADDGYMWLQQFPVGAHHAVTTMFDAEGQVVQWYIDICYRNGINEAGIPWMDDLYLDLIVLLNLSTMHKDMLVQRLHE